MRAKLISPPGFYDIRGISFTLHRPLIAHVDRAILGHAATSSVLAVVADPLDIDSTFIDEDQRLLKLEDQFATDDDVIFYNVSLQNPLAVFGNLRFRSTEAWGVKGKDTSTKASRNNKKDKAKDKKGDDQNEDSTCDDTISTKRKVPCGSRNKIIMFGKIDVRCS
jgi:hypothetical protein